MRPAPIAAAVTLAATVLAAGAPSAAGDQPSAALRALVCQRALDPPARAISIQAVMRPLAGTRRLELRFQLLVQRAGSHDWAPIRGGDLGAWLSPANPSLGQLPGDVWKISHPVVDLAGPASYRFRVSFRWLGSGHRVLGDAVRLSARCWQPELRPDVFVGAIAVKPVAGQPARDEYTATIGNAGATASGPFEVLFVPAGNLPPPTARDVPTLSSHASIQETFVGPSCVTGSAPTIIADPAGRVDDLNRANNTLTAVCPP
ncbi:MAG: hypothetical protein JO169_02575 [Solirubrobacterales bacterium]|nr:hypothetical protein [Solirubrobacterales bacterium]